MGFLGYIDQIINLKIILNVVIFSLIGLTMLAISFITFDKLSPGNLWKEIVEEHNAALAIAAGAFTIAMSLIIASAIHP